MLFIYIFFLLLAIFLLISLIRIKAVIEIDNFNINIALYILEIKIARRKLILKREKGPIFTLYQIIQNKEKKVASLYDIIKDIKKPDITDRQKFSRKKAIRYLLDKASFNIQVHVNVGVNGAYATAMVSGLLFIVSSALDAVYHRPNLKMELSVHPLFSKQLISIQANCIITLSVANIIIGYIIYKKI